MVTALSVDAFGAVAWGILGGFFFIAGLVQLIRGLASRSWNPVNGEIIESRVSHLWSGLVVAEIRYRYTIEGLTYEGDKLGFGKETNLSPSAAERAVSMYPKGRIVTLLVSPSDRSVAVIEPGVGWRVFMMLFAGVVMAAVGFGSFLL